MSSRETRNQRIQRGRGFIQSQPQYSISPDVVTGSTSANRRSPSVESDKIDERPREEHQGLPQRKKRIDSSGTSTNRNKKSKTKGKSKAGNHVVVSPWPDHFKELEKVFKSLNTVYTFISSRKHMAPIFANVKGSVEGLLKRPLLIDEVAQIKSLLPEIVKFAYIDPEDLESHSTADQKRDNNVPTKKEHLDENFYMLPSGKEEQKDENYVLIFEFLDGKLKSHLTGGYSGRVNRTRSDPSKAMKNIIENRNIKFSRAVNELLVASSSQDLDAVQLLRDASKEHIPVNPDSSMTQELLKEREDEDYFINNPQNRPSIESILAELCQQDFYMDQIVNGGHRSFERREAKYCSLDTEISEQISDALYQTRNVRQLYSHQAEALQHLRAGRNVIVCTSTSSGKSLIYQLPALSSFERDPSNTALYIFPTKALAQDQKRSLCELLYACPSLEHILVSTFDGDTAPETRDFIRENANVIFTNPDMLHVNILPKEEIWRRFLRNLKLIVVDELHTYGGLFGCHVGLIMRRLRRICAALGNEDVRFVSCSATISNPAEHMETLFGIKDVSVVDSDGSPSGSKEFVVWNPPYVEPLEPSQGRVSTISQASRLTQFLMGRGLKIMVFCKLRKVCEMLVKTIREELIEYGKSHNASKVMAYRSGYSAEDRRKIEKDMFNGNLLVIVATTALELGIDIGSLDAVLTVGFPWTLPGLRQQAGRAGRRNKDSLAVLLCDQLPYDQHYARNPDDLFDKPYSSTSISLDNQIVLEGHLQCAADELPIQIETDEQYFGPKLREICTTKLLPDEEGFYHCHLRNKPNPARSVHIRNIQEDLYTVVDTSKNYTILEDIEVSRAIFEIYEGAIFMHQGQTFLVKNVNPQTRIASVERANVSWTTQQRDFTDVDAVEALRIREIRNSHALAYYGRVEVISMVFGYYKLDRRLNVLDKVDVETPPFIRRTNGTWLDIPKFALDILASKNINAAGSIHSAAHALLGLTPLFVMSSVGEVRTECKAAEKELSSKVSQRVRPARITLYDHSGTNAGLCAKIFDHISDLIKQAVDAISACTCGEGCPSCVASASCSEGNVVCSKIGARVVLEAIIGREIDVDAIPVQETSEKAPPQSGSGSTIQAIPSPVKSAPNVLFEEESDSDRSERIQDVS